MLSAALRDVLDASVDLLLGGACVGCGRGGRALCAPCATLLPVGAGPAWPTPAPPGIAPPWAAAEYDGLVRDMVLAHKERGVLGLRAALGRLLAAAVLAALADRPGGTLLLVPVPSRPAAARARGHEPTAALTGHAAVLLRRAGHDVLALRMLRTRPGVQDQAGLDAAGRAANLAGSMHCPARSLRHLAARRSRARTVVCDDVLTTGATAREAQRALESVGLPVSAIATVAATRRRFPAAHRSEDP